MNLALSYAGAINDKKNLFIVAQPGLCLGMMGGSVSVGTNYYEESFAFGLGGLFSTGLDYWLGEHFIVNTRLGYRFISINETHRDPSSSTGYKTFYVNGSSGETVKVSWSGFFTTLGVAFVLDKKRKY